MPVSANKTCILLSGRAVCTSITNRAEEINCQRLQDLCTIPTVEFYVEEKILKLQQERESWLGTLVVCFQRTCNEEVLYLSIAPPLHPSYP